MMAARMPLTPLKEDEGLSQDELDADVGALDEALASGSICADDLQLNYADLEFSEQIGSGSYGKVYRGYFKGHEVAIKKEQIRLRDLAKYLAGEIAILREVSHPHLIKYYGASQHEKTVCIVTEYMNGGDLHHILAKTEVPIPWRLRLAIARDTAQAIAWLHQHDLIHRDIKTENILVDDTWRCVLADYGFARKAATGNRQAMTILGTDEFMAPEVVFGEEYDDRADVFSFGCVLAEIITRKAPGSNGFLMRNPRKKFAVDVEEIRAAAPPDTPPSLLECVAQCLAYEPDDRLTADMVVDWLTELLVDVEKAEAAHPTSPRPSVILGRSASTGGPAAAAASAGSGLGFAAADSNPAGSSSGASDVQ